MVKLQNVLFVYDYFNQNLPGNFQDTFNMNIDIIQPAENGRQLALPQWFNDYIFPDPNIQPHEDPIPGQLYHPNYESVRYGRKSITYQAIIQWNFFNRLFQDVEFLSLSRHKLKSIIVNHFMNSYNIRND